MKEIIYETKTGEDLISPATSSLLMTISRWTKFISIVGFVLIGMALVSILATGMVIGGVNNYMVHHGDTMYMPGIFTWSYAIGVIIYLLIFFIPMWYLFSFSLRIKKAFVAGDQTTLRDALVSLQRHYNFIGILIIVWLLFMVAGMIIMIAGTM